MRYKIYTGICFVVHTEGKFGMLERSGNKREKWDCWTFCSESTVWAALGKGNPVRLLALVRVRVECTWSIFLCVLLRRNKMVIILCYFQSYLWLTQLVKGIPVRGSLMREKQLMRRTAKISFVIAAFAPRLLFRIQKNELTKPWVAAALMQWKIVWTFERLNIRWITCVTYTADHMANQARWFTKSAASNAFCKLKRK